MWTPYNKLIYYTAARQRNNLRDGERVTHNQLYSRAADQADDIIDRSMPSHRIVDGLKWPREAVKQDLNMPKLSDKIQQFLKRPNHSSRKALEQLLLAYYVSGFGLHEAVMHTFRDYETIDDRVVPLTELDILNYATFFWDFSSGNKEEHEDYISKGIRDPDIIDIYHTTQSLSDVRMEWGVIRDYEAGKELRRLAMLNTKIAQKISRDLQDADTLENSRSFKHIAQFQTTTINVVKAASEIGGGEQTAVSLNDFFNDMWDEVDSDIQDYREMEDHEMTPDELYAENEEVMDDDQIKQEFDEEKPDDSANDEERHY
jgi:hypothetical protein